jgi:hypothetical protein
MRRICLLVLGPLALVLLGAAPAWAATLTVSPTTVARGQQVTVTGTCEPNTSGVASSTAFLHDATHDFAGAGAAPFTTDTTGAFHATALVPASTQAGTYHVTARCGGGNLGVVATLTVVAKPRLASTGVPTRMAGTLGGLLVAAGCALAVIARRRPA